MTLTLDNLTGYATWLRDEEKSKGTIAKYTKDVSDFIVWLDGRELTKDELLCWKIFLCDKNIAPSTVNGKLASLNSLLRYVERADLSVKYLKVQRRVFRNPQREMTKKEFRRLLKAVEESGDVRLLLLMEAIACTGIRVSELKYITVEAAKDGRAVVVGPHMENFPAVSEDFRAAGAWVQAKDAAEVGATLDRWLGNAAERERIGRAAAELVAAKAGATAEMARRVAALMG